MSRRAKLTILSIVLVLCGIVISIAIYSWRPESPLRISLAPGQELPPQASPSEYFLVPYHIIVENTSSSEFHFYVAGSELDDAAGPGPGMYPAAFLASPEWENSQPVAAGILTSIPPHRSVRCTVLPSGGGDLSAALRGNLVVTYRWRSPLNLRYTQFRNWLHNHAPSPLQDFLREPDYFKDTTPLKMPPPPPPPPPPPAP